MTGVFLRYAMLCVASLGVFACSASPGPINASFNAPVMEPTNSVSSKPQHASADDGSIGEALSGWWNKVTSNSQSDTPEGVQANKVTAARFDPAAAQKLVNDYRRQKGLKPLTINAKLTAAARAHSEDLAKHDRISHYGSDGGDPWARVTKTGYPARLAAENVGTGQFSIEEVFEGWRKSPDHNANLLLADAREMGVALVYRPETEFKTFWTLVIGAPDGPVTASR
jgi:uncharacterized protein YkwD